MEGTCKYCGKPFKSEYKNKIYCSYLCYDKYHRQLRKEERRGFQEGRCPECKKALRNRGEIKRYGYIYSVQHCTCGYGQLVLR